MRYQTIRQIASVAAVVAGVMLAASALAQYYSSTPPMFPVGWYVSPPQPFTFESPTLTSAGIASIDLYDLVHTPGQVTTNYYDSSGNYWVERFTSTLTGTANINLLGGGQIVGSLFAGGPGQNVTVLIMGSNPPEGVGSWTTSMTILDWPATVSWDDVTNNIWLQCGDAPGLTTVTFSNSLSLYVANSYFTVTPQISLDNSGWTTADQPGDVTLVPEPSGLALLSLGTLSLLAYEWRRRKA